MLVDARYYLKNSTIEAVSRAALDANGETETRFGPVSQVVFYDHYSRRRPDGKRKETYLEACVRVVNGTLSIRLDHFEKNGLRPNIDEFERRGAQLLDKMLRQQFLPPGRGLWALGSNHVYRDGSMALNNCGATTLEDSSFAFDQAWGMEASMLGVGVGYGLRATNRLRLALSESDVIQTYNETQSRWPKSLQFLGDNTFGISDSRQGWVASTALVINHPEAKFDYRGIRPKGQVLHTFGGIASGPAPLMILHRRLRAYHNLYLNHKIQTTRFSADCANANGKCIVSGNIRRSAQILIGSIHDKEFLGLKRFRDTKESLELKEKLDRTYDLVDDRKDLPGATRWLNSLPDDDFLSDRPNIMHLSNNTVALQNNIDFISIPTITNQIVENGEPGILNLLNIAAHGRLRDLVGNGIRKDYATLCNPCGEIQLENKELCNLSEVFPTHCQTDGQLREAITLATFYAQTVSLLKTVSSETNAVVARNRRIGVSMTGIAEWQDNIGTFQMTRLLRDNYRLVVETAAALAAEAGVPSPIRHTTVKPSGTVSLLAGVPSGMHYPLFSHAIRRVTVDKDGPMDETLKKAGYTSEQSLYELNSVLYSFPITYGKVRPSAKVSAWEQLCLLATLQREWADNMVSASIYFDPKTEAQHLSKMLGQFAPLIKSASFFPIQNEVYKQAPFEEITLPQYYKLSKELKPIDWESYRYLAAEANTVEAMPDELKYCEGDACLIPPTKV